MDMLAFLIYFKISSLSVFNDEHLLTITHRPRKFRLIFLRRNTLSTKFHRGNLKSENDTLLGKELGPDYSEAGSRSSQSRPLHKYKEDVIRS